MDRSIDDKNILDKFCIDFSKIIEKYTKYIIVSGFVAISTGRTRGTEDIDMIIPKLQKETFFKIHKELVENDFVCMQSDNEEEIYSYLEDNLCVRYTRKNQPLPEMELKFAKDYLDNYQLTTGRKIPLTKLDVWFSSIEMNIAFKEEYLKSDKDLEDAKHLRTIFSDEIDEDEIQRVKRLIKEHRL